MEGCPFAQVEQLARERQELMQAMEEARAGASALQHAQAQLADSDALVQQQAVAIKQLEAQLLAEGQRCRSGGDSRWQALEAENASLRQALLHAQAQAVQAQAQQAGGSWSGAGATPHGSAAHQLEEAEAQLARLQAVLQLREEQHQRQLRAVRQEHERLRVEQGIK